MNRPSNKQSTGTKRPTQNPRAVNFLHVFIGLIVVSIGAAAIYFGLYSLNMTVSSENTSGNARFLIFVLILATVFILFGLGGIITRQMVTIFGRTARLRAQMTSGISALQGSSAVVAGISVMATGLGIVLTTTQAYPQILAFDFETPPPTGQNPIPFITAFSLTLLGYIVGHIMQAMSSRRK